MKPRRSWWMIYGACTAVVGLALVWITITVVRLERAELAARADAEHQEALRLALWRMDSWLAPLLAREAARPYFDYQPFSPQQRAYTALLNPIEPGEVLAPSPLLSFQSQYFALHFQIAPDGRLSSPQAPVGRDRELAEDAYLSQEQISSNVNTLDGIGNLVTRQEVAQCVAQADVEPPPMPWVPPADLPQAAQQLKSRQELSKRKGTYRQAIEAGQQQAADPLYPDESVTVGALVSFWSLRDADGALELIFTRAVWVADQQYFQGFLCDWLKLRDALMAEIGDLFAEARLVPVRDAAHQEQATGITLATIPVALEVAPPVPLEAGFMSPARSTLALTWLAVLAGIVAVAVTLRSSIAFGEKRSRFASAVTHELRTPLTTFRMYSEMLAEGMVTDAGQRQDYLETLRDESGRLSTLVENVLAYARLEEGRGPTRAERTTLGAVLDRVLPNLRKRAESCGMELAVTNEAPGETALTVDVEAVGQILFNLIDNACKYSAEASPRTVHLNGRLQNGALSIRVRDHGPGVPPGLAGSVFTPFDRGARNHGDATPGVGLGLALARGLARDLGGDLALDPTPGDGASFRLTLPV